MSSPPVITNSRPNTRSTSANKPIENLNQNINSNKSAKSSKRKATNTSPTTITPEAKKTTANKMTGISIDDLERIMERQMEKQTQAIKNEIKSLGDELKANLEGQIVKNNDRIDEMQEHVNAQLQDVRTDVDKCIEQLDLGEDNNKRIALLNELKLNGIAHRSGENLKEIFMTIAQLIGFDTSNPLHIPDLTRSIIRNRQSNEIILLPLIIIRFVAKHIRNKFYGLYLSRISKQPILTENINLPQGGRILIGENLTPHNQTIFKDAIKLKRDKKVMRVNTVDGLVFIRANLSQKMSCIKTRRDLDLFVANLTTNNGSQLINNNTNEHTNDIHQPQSNHQPGIQHIFSPFSSSSNLPDNQQVQQTQNEDLTPMDIGHQSNST